MKNKLFLTILCIIGLCLGVACSMGIDAKTTPAAENLDADIDEIIKENDDFSEEFFMNQNMSFNIMDEAMSPFRIAYDPETGEGREVYHDCFAGKWIDETGRLNIGVVQDAVTEQIAISINNLTGQVP